MPQVQRDREIKKRRNLALKKRALKERIVKERDAKVRARLVAKLKKISPNSPIPER